LSKTKRVIDLARIAVSAADEEGSSEVSYHIRLAFSGISLFLLLLLVSPSTSAQIPGLKNPSPELVGQLTKSLSIKPDQAVGGAGAIFGLAKTRLKPDEFSQIAKVVPGMDGLLGAAPKPKEGSTDITSMASMIPGKYGRLAEVAGAFQSLGMSPSMAAKFVPLMSKFVQTKGDAKVAGLLTGALK
jgi:hypothetical protein